MSYMTQSNMEEVSTFMQELAYVFENHAPPNIELDFEIKVSKWQSPLGRIVQNTDGICFVPEGEAFKPYTAPKVKVKE